MNELNEKSKEKKINDNPEIKDNELERNDNKKPTLSLSEIPNIINDETIYSDKIKRDIPSKFAEDRHSITNAFYYQNKLKSNFINEPISHNKEESRSSLSEIQIILKTAKSTKVENNKNKLPGKKEKRKRIYSKKNNNIDSPIKSKRNKEQDKEGEEPKYNIKIKKKFQSSKKGEIINDLDEEQKGEKNKKGKIKFRKSEVIKRFKKNSIVEEVKRKSPERNSLSPEKNPTNQIFKKFFDKKQSSELKEEKRNLDKIYININNKEESLITVNTTQETVKNYYNNMQDCFQIIDLYFNKTIKLMPGEPVNFHFKENKKIVIFELESTLISYLGETSSTNININNNTIIGINIRPHLKSSLDLIKNDYNIVIYSSSSKIYVDKILDFLDPNHDYFNYRLYKENCYKFNIDNKTYYTKNLNIFKNLCDLKDIVIVDCSVLGFGFFLENGIPIIPFYDSKEDVELKLVSYYLACISSNYDLREALKRDMKLYSYLEVAKNNNEKIGNIGEETEEQEKDKTKKNKKIKEKSLNIYPMNNKKKKKNKLSNKISNNIQNEKGSSDSEEDKKSIDNKHKNNEKTKKHKKELDKKSQKRERHESTKLLKKRNNRKYTDNEFNRINLNIKSPKKTSRGKSHKGSRNKNKDKNKIFSNFE